MKKQVEVLVDDIDQRTEAVKTMPFVIDGKAYEIDLGEQNLARFYRVLEPFMAVARTEQPKQLKQAAPKRNRKSRAKAKTATKRPSRAKAAGPTPSQIREWARQTGYPVGKAGRVSAAAREAFLEAHAKKQNGTENAAEIKDALAA